MKNSFFKICYRSNKKKVMAEPEVLKQTFLKIAALLAIGFGEAGSEVVGKNLNSSKGEVNPMI